MRICSNYRRIILIDGAANVFGVILVIKFQSERDQSTILNQCGFWTKRGRTDHVHNLCHTLQQCWNFQHATVVRLVGISSVFDSVDKGTL